VARFIEFGLGANTSVRASLEQTARYADQCGADSAHLLIFNRDPGVSWDDKFTVKSMAAVGVPLACGGCEGMAPTGFSSADDPIHWGQRWPMNCVLMIRQP